MTCFLLLFFFLFLFFSFFSFFFFVNRWQERDKVLELFNAPVFDPRVPAPKDEAAMSVEDAIQLLQRHERARQGRLRAKFMMDIRAQQERERMLKEFPRAKLSQDAAAICIQKTYRGYITRKRIARQRENEVSHNNGCTLFFFSSPLLFLPSFHRVRC
jgi:hypothetical protein